ncbi:hypothetical protein FQN54_009580 [Arachnomyces sp. PD_36]|nr:hypothetical protein FQN54_009580 [Arachnomyces sp. PD_36]
MKFTYIAQALLFSILPLAMAAPAPEEGKSLNRKNTLQARACDQLCPCPDGCLCGGTPGMGGRCFAV